MTGDKSKYDSGYEFDDNLFKIIREIKARGFELGFHPSYYTFEDYNKFAMEKENLDGIIKSKKYGGRQHYLRFTIGKSLNIWEEMGLQYDSSLGYAEEEGFRCGTSHPYKLYDFEKDEEGQLIEIPLIVMDVTLKNYKKILKGACFEKDS